MKLAVRFHPGPVVWALLMLCLGLAGPASADGANFFGVWDVNTTLVAASDAVNPTYRPGDLRVDVWQVSGSASQPMLTTRDGTVPGQIVGDQAQFFTEVPLDQILVMRVIIQAYLTSSRSMQGTINAEYWDTRFGYKIGLDAWTFEALRR